MNHIKINRLINYIKRRIYLFRFNFQHNAGQKMPSSVADITNLNPDNTLDSDAIILGTSISSVPPLDSPFWNTIALNGKRKKSAPSTINLLPIQIVTKRRFNKLIKIMAAAQVAIIFISVSLILLAMHYRQGIHRQSEQIMQVIRTTEQHPQALIREIADARRRIADMQAFYEAHTASRFQAEWMNAILAATPQDAVLQTAIYNGTTIWATARTANIDSIETHRQQILSADLFSGAGLGRIWREDNGFRYEIIVLLP